MTGHKRIKQKMASLLDLFSGNPGLLSALLGKTPPANADFYDPQDEAAAARDAAAKQFLRPLMAASIVQKVDAV
jgi:hypothetical protein